MKIDVLVAEIGSTTTVINAFKGVDTDHPEFICQGQAPTSVSDGDVTIGLRAAMDDLQFRLGHQTLDYNELLATSSAAGGLKMTVHGLVYDMTAKAAREAALGAGANIHLVTAGKLRRTDLKKIKDVAPNIILIAGGVDYGERDTALENAEKIVALDLDVPVIYAGNIENHEEIKLIFEEEGKAHLLHIVDNVYPQIDVLNVEPTRAVIQDVFEEHIVHAPGMSKVRELVNGPIIPTPGSVMEAAKLLKSHIGDLIVFDVGGATTDLHSVTEGSEEISRILLSPEPVAKRTVEGDLGVYINMHNIVDLIGIDTLVKDLGYSEHEVKHLIDNHVPIPKSEQQKRFVERLTKEAVLHAVDRHAGGFRTLFGGFKKTLAVGKDLTSVKYIVGTGGALTRLDARHEILKSVATSNKGDKLYPTEEAKILIDNDYIMASLGVLSKVHPGAAYKLMKHSLELDEE
ncbi:MULTISPECIES: GlmL-related ornithine degradation protein [unclassified Fusibacter]|uniref:GlmL-related ornithine degradation protein n=1 Tax=unclassified Fusibacter TaxID=2624464 RepID=UPI0010129578|nr:MULTISPECIES: GlmL-related ornithine degradation protein [unclassified Fusibacter]MCK8059018.1 GlmL-related ornithine degradation protein [Fusibacter sp. A2]NPE22429.1 DNA mismatch repair protein MutL [Fusibacter sp. A1]RXV60534.1 DNA mismatch repair protein MutL [Fusibacter sp. A1]